MKRSPQGAAAGPGGPPLPSSPQPKYPALKLENSLMTEVKMGVGLVPVGGAAYAPCLTPA